MKEEMNKEDEERAVHELRERLAQELYEEQLKEALETETPPGDLWDDDNPVMERIFADLQERFGSGEMDEEDAEFDEDDEIDEED